MTADLIHTNHNVYILGAGFSREAGLPLVADFLNCMRDSIDWLIEQPNREEELNAIRDVFKFRLGAAGAAYRTLINVENIEDLFSLASASDDEQLPNSIPSAIAATLDYARRETPHSYCKFELDTAMYEAPESWKETNRGIRKRGDWREYECPLYHFYAGILSGRFCKPSPDMRNTIITFNYDTLLEDALTEIGVPFQYSFPVSIVDYCPSAKAVPSNQYPNALQILKLHGSVNWGTQINRDKISIHGTYKDAREEKDIVLLVPPTWRKVFGGILTSAWTAASKALTEATRVIIIGFSMQPTDMHFKYLLSAGLRNNISLRQLLFINPGRNQKHLENNLFTIMRPELKEQGLILYEPLSTGSYLTNSINLKSINRDSYLENVRWYS